MGLREAVHNNDQGHFDVHGPQLRAQSQTLKRGALADVTVQAPRCTQPSDQTKVHPEGHS